MKKFLSLVMALIMVMSLVTVASAADYTDAADVDKAEAVDVMSAVGVFQGSAGKFNPKAILNRAEAAKLIAYLDLGEKTAEALPAVQAFSDVPATHWAAKYIAYCADAGYINGVGNGKFNPAGKLTGYEFGKLVLCVLGYDATIESFTGASWSIAVAKLMQSNDINDGVKAAPSGDLTREDAAQYCLNALKATTVEYASKGTNVTINGVVIATGASKAEEVLASGAAKYAKIDDTQVGNKYTVELGEKLYEGKLVLNEKATDDFGRTATEWTYKNDVVGKYADTADFTFTVKTKAADIAKELKGITDAEGYKVENDTKYVGYTNKTAAENIADMTDNGKLVEIFVNSSDKITKIVTANYTVGEVTKISTNTKTGDVTYYIDGASKGTVYTDEDTTDTIVLAGKIAKGDIVTYTNKNGKNYVYPTTVKEGKVTSAKNGDHVTLDGVKYAASCVADASADTQKVWFDQFGVVCKTDAVDSDVEYVYFAHKYTETVKNVDTYYVQIVTAAGEIKELKVKNQGVYDSIVTDRVGTYTTASGKVTSAPYVMSGDVVPLVVDQLIEADAIKLDAANTTSNKVYFFADDVTVVYVDGDGDDLKTSTSKTIDKVKVPMNSYAVLDDGEVAAIFIAKKASASTASSDLLFVADAASQGSIVNKDDKKVTAYEFYLNGEAAKYGVHDDSDDSVEVGYFSYAVDNKTGDLLLTKEEENIFEVTVELDNGVVYEIRKDAYVDLGTDLDGHNAVNDYVNAADAVIYDTTDNKLTTLTDIVNLVKDDNNVSSLKLFCVYDDKAEKVTMIYVVE